MRGNFRAFFLLAVCALSFSAQTFAEDEASKTFEIGPRVATVVPVYVGAGADLTFLSQYQVGLSYGFTPTPYSATIGEVVAQLGGNSAYRDVIKAAFQNNSLIRLDLQYAFTNSHSGWKTGVAISRLTSSGQAGIDNVLRAATGKDYTQLKNLLSALGRSTDVSIEGTLLLAELQVSYVWQLMPQLNMDLAFGVGKVVGSDIRLQSGLPNFEASAAGSSLMRSSESELEKIVVDNGWYPTIGANLSYVF